MLGGNNSSRVMARLVVLVHVEVQMRVIVAGGPRVAPAATANSFCGVLPRARSQVTSRVGISTEGNCALRPIYVRFHSLKPWPLAMASRVAHLFPRAHVSHKREFDKAGKPSISSVIVVSRRGILARRLLPILTVKGLGHNVTSRFSFCARYGEIASNDDPLSTKQRTERSLIRASCVK